MTHSIEKTLIIGAPPATVWAFLTQADELARWFHRPKSDLSEGQDFEMPGEDGNPLVWGHVHEATAPRTLRFSFTARPMGDLVSEVSYALTAVEAGTRLNLVHSGFPAGAEAFGLLTAFDAGWDSHLTRMRDSIA